MSIEHPDYRELIKNLKPLNSRPTYDEGISLLEAASRVAAMYRELGIGKASIIADSDEPMVSLMLPTSFARELIDAYLLQRGIPPYYGPDSKAH